MVLNNVLKLQINAKNLHFFGVTPANPFHLQLSGSKFFALLRILEPVPEDEDGFKWLQINNPFGFASHIGLKVDCFKCGGFKLHSKFAMELKKTDYK